MKNIKKLIAMLLCVMMLVSVVACNTAKTDDDAAADDGIVDITYAQWGNDLETENCQAVADAFFAENGKIRVTVEQINQDDYATVLNARAASGELPDTCIMGEQTTIAWALNGMLLDVSDMYADAPAKPIECITFTYDGHDVCYGAANEMGLLYYNRDMFDAAGVDYPPTNPEEAYTWDEFIEVAKQLTLDKNGKTPNDAGFDAENITQYGVVINTRDFEWDALAQSNGGGISVDKKTCTFGSAETIEAAQAIADLTFKEHVQPVLDSSNSESVDGNICAGNVAMTIDGHWAIGVALNASDINYGIGVLPKFKTPVTFATGGPNVAFATTEHPEEAMTWLAWYAKEENNWDNLIATGIWMPTLESYYTDAALTEKWLSEPGYATVKDDAMAVFPAYYPYQSAPAWCYNANYAPMVEVINNAMAAVWSGDVSAEEAITAIAPEVEQLFNEGM